MNVEADMSGHVSSQSGAQLPGVSHQNGNAVPDIVAAGGGVPHAAFGVDTDLVRARRYMQEKIFVLLAQRHQQPINDSQMQKLKDIVIRLEDGLFKSSHSMDEYMNLDTLESRLHSLIKRPSPNNQNPVNPISMTTMIPSPGLSHNGSSTMTVTTSVDGPMSNIAGSSSVQPTNANTGSLMSNRINPKAYISGHLSCQSGTQLPGLSQQNGNVVLNIVAAGTGALHAAFSVDTDLLRARSYMQEKIFVLLAQRHAQPINDSQMQKLKDIVIRLEDGLFKSSHSKDEYMNLGTLESRLRSLIKRPTINNRNPVNPNSMTTMIPTPGLSHNGSSTMMATSSVDAPLSNMDGSSSMQPTNANTGSLMSSGVMQTQESLCEALCQLEL
ncbi:histone acetyltransferase HAC1-like isoform X1 [Syzygium oleosum]|uniref:histone acetyltransferase HAC1-like isoform X1 n=2 Tax=Syzygium oleosum TaxID=219896 RepID=UPI0024BBDBEA|nr:histone acetyltransferase HAC1-like isoform X1 [Syzygium oleosum]XP_056173794.1 histone acetyltransferase HAC1-like isoform X1 [Syzygium oleosum]